MKAIITLLFVAFTYTATWAQSLTGIWRGTFEQSGIDIENVRINNDVYKYEVQINDLENKSVEGVTYSYLTTVFYGKAALKGMFNKAAKTLTIKETKMIELKGSGSIVPCLMTCYLDYKKVGKLEILSGTYSSVREKDGSDCGNGTVYLERVQETNFTKEPFLTKKKNAKTGIIPNKSSVAATTKPKLDNPKTSIEKATTTKSSAKIATAKAANKPATNENKKPSTTYVQKPVTATINSQNNKPRKSTAKVDIAKKDNKLKVDSNKLIAKIEPTKPIETKHEDPTTKKIEEPVAKVLKERDNKLVNTIYVDAKEVTLEFYDNGEIDGDTISVYKDNNLVVDKKMLTTNPITLKLTFDDYNTFYEIITVAENLGSIPPNTSVMVINYGRKRKEVSLTSDEKSNAKLVIEYKKD